MIGARVAQEALMGRARVRIRSTLNVETSGLVRMVWPGATLSETHTRAVIRGVHVDLPTHTAGGVAVQVVMERGHMSAVLQRLWGWVV